MSNPNIASRFDEIYNSTNKAALAYITIKCKNTFDIADIMQDTYMELYQVLDKRGAGYIKNEKAFVLRIAKQKISRYYSLLERLRIFVSISVTDEGENEIELTDFEADTFSLEDYTVNKVLLEKLRQFVQSKPEDVKKVFYLFYDAGLTVPEIANALSMGESNVKNKLYRTLKEVRNLLKER